MYGKLLHAIFYDANFKITAVIKKINKKILYVGIGFIAIAVAVVFLPNRSTPLFQPRLKRLIQGHIVLN